MISLGERLRRERVARGIELPQIVEETKIHTRYLQALEEGDLKTLPGIIFARSFARQYARCIGLDQKEIEADLQRFLFAEATPEEPPAPKSVLPRIPAMPSEGLPGSPRLWGVMLALIAVLAACTVLYAIWASWGISAAAPTKDRGGADAAKTAPVASPSRQPAAGAIETRGQTESQPPQTGAGEERDPAVAPAPGAVQVQITAKESTWLSASSAGRTLFTGTLEAGRTQTFSAQERMRLRIGNAGGLEVSLNGKPVGPIGPRGQTRVVVLTVDGAEILTPPPATPNPSTPPVEPPPVGSLSSPVSYDARSSATRAGAVS